MWSIFILLPKTTKIKQNIWKNHFQDSEDETMQESNSRKMGGGELTPITVPN